jgi:transketolase
MTSASRGLDNLVALVDNNSLKSQGPTAEAKPLEPLTDKWAAFGWHVLAVDGHNVGAVCGALDEAETVKGKPTVILARTVKGKGVAALEGRYEYHNAALSREQWQTAMHEVAWER